MFSRPALVVAVCYATGIVLWRCAPLDAAFAWPASLFVLAAAIVARRALPWAAPVLFICMAVVSGYAGAALALTIEPEIDRAVTVAEDGREHLFYATICDDPSPRTDGVLFRAALTAVRDGSGTRSLCDATVRVFCVATPPDSVAVLSRGDRLALFGRLRAPRGVRNPGDFNYAAYLRLQGIVAELSIRSSSDVERLGSDPPNVISSAIASIRRSIAHSLDRYVGGEEGDLLKGLLIGERGMLSDETRWKFMATGTFHVLAVSGLHVAFVALMLYGLLSPVMNRYLHAGLFMAGLLIYSALAGGAASIVRAALMGVLATVALLLERRIDPPNIVGGAACIILVVDPGQVFGAGFQLSFAAAMGLAAFQPKLRVAWVRGRIARVRWLRWGAEMACASVAAQLATLPLTALYFERLSPAGVIANLIVVPASGLALGMAAMVAAASPAPWLATLLGDGAREFVRVFLGVVEKMSDLPFASVTVAPFGIVQSIAFYAAIAFVIVGGSRPAMIRRFCIAGAAAIALVVAPWRSTPILQPGVLTVAVLDVGQGDGIVVGFPNGKVMIVDAGPASRTHLAPLPVPAFLQREGIRRVSALVLTHLHGDHIGGAVDLLKRVVVDTVYHSGQRTGDALVKSLDSLVVLNGIPIERATEGTTVNIDTSVRVYVLHPDTTTVRNGGETEGGNLNNGSVVLLVRYGATTLLLSGDLEAERENALAARYGEFLRAEVLKIGHHGSKTSTTDAYVAAVHPREAVVSVGENHFGHPSPLVLDRLCRAGIVVRRTDVDGAVIWRSNGREWQSVDWRQESGAVP